MPSTESNTVRVSTEMFPAKDRFTAFREDWVRRALAMDVIDHSDGRPRVDLSFRPLGQIVISTARHTPIEFVRGKHHIKDGKGEFVLTMIDAGAGWEYEHTGDEHRFFAGSVGFRCLARPWRSITEATRSSHIAIPDATLKTLVQHPEDLAGKPVRPGPAVRLLRDYLRSLADLAEPPRRELAATIGAHLLDLVAAALGPMADAREMIADRGIRAARIRQIQTEIRRRCSDPGFDLDHVTRSLGLSRRYVQQLMELTEKSFTAHLIECRLERAAAMLKDRRCDHRSIAEVAFASGFGNISHFNRLFRRRFGDTPSGMRVAGMK